MRPSEVAEFANKNLHNPELTQMLIDHGVAPCVAQEWANEPVRRRQMAARVRGPNSAHLGRGIPRYKIIKGQRRRVDKLRGYWSAVLKWRRYVELSRTEKKRRGRWARWNKGGMWTPVARLLGFGSAHTVAPK